MNTSQLQCMIACDPMLRDGVLGVFAADQLPRTVPFKPCGVIVNTDNSNQPGTHWLAFYIQPNSVECFDSYGQSPGSYNPLLSQWLQRHARHVQVNWTHLQSDRSNVCGLYCVYFLHQRLIGRSMAQILSGFSSDRKANDHFILDLFKNVYPDCIEQEGTYHNQGCQPRCRDHPF